MDARQDFGRASEKQAERFLRAQRHRILARNYRTRQGEIDIVSLARDGVVVFTEVRSKHDCEFGHPIETVDVRKQKRIRAAAKQFLQAHPRYQAHACRFDVITVVGEGKAAQLEHFLDAF